jgi:hypothetical protein
MRIKNRSDCNGQDSRTAPIPICDHTGEAALPNTAQR